MAIWSQAEITYVTKAFKNYIIESRDSLVDKLRKRYMTQNSTVNVNQN